MRRAENLSHHEQLRLDYLYKNYYYLNDKEKRELAYLRQKAKGNVHESNSRPVADYADSEEGISSSDPIDNVQTDSSGLLPKYPERPSRSRRQKKTKQISSAAVVDQPQPAPKKRRKIRIKRILLWLGIFLLLVLGGMIAMFIKGYTTASAGNSNVTDVEHFDGQDSSDGVNILILGTDGRVGEQSTETRTDSIMVLNVGNKDHKIKLVSFMRDTLIHVDGASNIYADPSQEDYYDQKLNVAYTFGEQENHQGADFVRQVLKDHFDIDIKYYALVDFQTFATAIDTLFPNGVSMDAKFSTINGEAVTEVEVPDDLNMKDGVVPNQIIKVGKQQMDGRTLLNYARFRKDDEGDFGRTRRQQEVLTAIFQQVKDPTKLFTGAEALGKVFALTSTNVPSSFLLFNSFSLLLSSRNGVERLTIPENGDWVDTYDMYGGQGLLIDFEAYKERLHQMGLR